MQPFRLRKDAKSWFKILYDDGSFKIGFDAFYFCFIAGLTTPSGKRPAPQDETDELVDYFPDRYKNRGSLLVSLFLKQELNNLGVTMADKKEVHSTIAQLVSTESQHRLSEEGVKEFNKYAHGGFDVLLEWFDDKPRSLETFLRIFHQKVNSAVSADR